MNKYVVAFCSLQSGDITQEIVEATSKYEAMRSYLNLVSDDLHESTEEGIYEYACNTDTFITALQIDIVSRSGRSGNGLQIHLAEFDSPASLQ